MIEIKLEGMDVLYRELRKFPEDVQRKVVKQATLAGATIIKKVLADAAPVRVHPSVPMGKQNRSPGFLKKNVKVWVNKHPHRAATLTYAVGVTKNAFYARFIEFGYTLRNGVKWGPRPWFRPAQETVEMHALDITVAKTKALIGKFMRHYAALKWVG